MDRPDILTTIERMVHEQGDTWLSSLEDRDQYHNAVVITDSPERCFRLQYRDGQWITWEDRLTSSELSDFFAAFGSHWAITLNSWLDTGSGIVRVRAFIKNGVKARSGFSVSIDAVSAVQARAA